MNKLSSGVYVDDQYMFNYPDGIQHNYWNVARNKFLLSNIVQLSDKSEKLKILDIGCARGIVVSYLKESGLNVLGVEDGASTTIDAQHKNLIMYNSNAFLLDENIRSEINTILLLDVLEHIEEPKAFLKSCLDSFKNLKYIIITLPARKELWTNYDTYYGHFLRYDCQTAQELVKDFKFKKIEMSYFFHLLYFPIFLVGLLNRKREIKYTPPGTIFQKLIHRTLGVLFYLDSKYLPSKLPGSSLLLRMEL